jgi:hypothetical protein
MRLPWCRHESSRAAVSRSEKDDELSIILTEPNPARPDRFGKILPEGFHCLAASVGMVERVPQKILPLIVIMVQQAGIVHLDSPGGPSSCHLAANHGIGDPGTGDGMGMASGIAYQKHIAINRLPNRFRWDPSCGIPHGLTGYFA